MANELTGDFDVVAEFSVLAANRVLAAMHRGKRFLHSISIRVDDSPPGPRGLRPSIAGSLDTFGSPTVDHTRIGTVVTLQGTSHPIRSALDWVVNMDLAGIFVEPVLPSNLQGRAQLQLSPPTIEIPDASGTKITAVMRLMARYFPDPNTSPLAEFVHGDLRITAAVDQVASQTANVVEIDLKANQVIINFTPISSSKPLSAADLAAVSLLIRNALKTSFLPSNEPLDLPSNIKHMQFKTLLGAQNAIALLLNANNPRGNPASLNNVFLGAGDEFAFAAGKDFILGKIKFQPISNRRVPLYNLLFQLPTVEFQPGRIVLRVKGHAARRRSYSPPAFNFTVTQAFTLKLVSTTGGPFNTAELEADGDPSVDPWYADWLQYLFAQGEIRKQRDDNLKAIQPTVRDALDVKKNLGDFLKSLMNPVKQQPVGQFQEPLNPVLAYTSVEIKPSGIVLHGSLAVPDWPPAHVEFEQIPANTGGGIAPPVGAIPDRPDYTALKSWIPGGRIERYEWSSRGQILHADEHRFVLVDPPPVISGGVAFKGPVTGFTPICLTVKGMRIASSGPAVDQPVSATACVYNSVSVIPGELISASSGALPMVALTQPGPRGLVEVVGHASGHPRETGGAAPNLIVHFGDEKSADRLDLVTRALSERGREDAATAVLAVLTPDQLGKSRYTEGVIYAEEQGGAWERVFGVKTPRRPVTLVVGPQGKVVWQHEGEIDSQNLADALRKLPAAGRFRGPRLLRSNLRIGWPAANFLFEYAPGRGLTLRKLEEAVLVFWKSSSKPSIEAVRDLQETARKARGQGPVVLAINDGEAPELAKKAAAENGLSATLVPDPKRQIALAYGVNIWPMAVFMDELGLVREIRYGRFAGEQLEHPTQAKAAAAQSARKMA